MDDVSTSFIHVFSPIPLFPIQNPHNINIIDVSHIVFIRPTVPFQTIHHSQVMAFYHGYHEIIYAFKLKLKRKIIHISIYKNKNEIMRRENETPGGMSFVAFIFHSFHFQFMYV